MESSSRAVWFLSHIWVAAEFRVIEELMVPFGS